MSYIIIIAVITFIGVTLIVLGLSMLMRNKPLNRIEDRLGMLTGKINPAAKEILSKESVLAHPLDDSPGLFERFIQQFGDLNKIFEQADTSLTALKLLLISIGMAMFGGVLALPFALFHY